MNSVKSDEDEYDSEDNNSAVSEPDSVEDKAAANKSATGRLPLATNATTTPSSPRKPGAPAGKGKRGAQTQQQQQPNSDNGQPVQQISIGANGALQYQMPNGVVSVLTPFNLGGNNAGNPGSASGAGGHSVDMGSLGTTVIMTQDGQQFLIPVSLSGDGQLQSGQQLMKQQQHAGGSMNSNSSSGSSSANILSSSNNLSGQQQVMAEEVGRKRETRLLKNREAAKECRRKKKEYIKCLENRVAVLENQNKALIEELKSLKELYCKSTTHD